MANTQSYDLTGIVSEIGATEQVTSSFKKRELVIEQTNGDYTETIQFEFIQANCDKPDKIRIGQTVTVSFNIKGRKASNGRIFNQLQGWKIV